MTFMVDEKKLFELIDILRVNFNPENIEDYQKVIFIIYNSLFLDNEVQKSTKYKIFSLLDTITMLFNDNIINEEEKEEEKEEENKELTWIEIYDEILSWKLRQDSICF